MRIFSASGLALALALLSVGCVLEVPAGAVLTLPASPLDLDGARAVLEGRLCADAGSDGCAVLTALDGSDGEMESPVAMPPVMPQYMEIERFGASAIDIERWFVDEAVVDTDVDLLPGRLVRLADVLDLDAIDHDALEGVSLHAASLVVTGNGLTLDVPEYDLWIGDGTDVDEAGVVVARDPSAAVRFARSEPLAAGVDGQAPLWLADGAVDALKDALRGGDPWIELRSTAPEPDLQPGEEFRTLVRPGGRADLAVELRLSVPVSIDTATAALELN